MNIKAVLIDFDGTLVAEDILSEVSSIVGKKDISIQLNREYIQGVRPGLPALITRINFLKGVSIEQIKNVLDKNDFLMPGAKELLNFTNEKGIISILHSGNILPILEYYQKELGITHLVGTKPKMKGTVIDSISQEDFSGNDFKLIGCKEILTKLSIGPDEVIAIGDSPADKTIFEFAAKSIVINPKGGIEKKATFVIHDDLSKAVKVIEDLLTCNEQSKP